MSHFTVIAEVSRALRRLLFEELNKDAIINQFVSNETDIVFLNPERAAVNTTNKLSLWLFQITENEYVKNQPMIRVKLEEKEQLRFPPMAINLLYLITPLASTGSSVTELNDYYLLGKAMQTFYDNASVYLRKTEPKITEEMRITFARMSLEELTRVWEALHVPYRLSVCYHIRVTHVESLRTPETKRVIELDERVEPREVV